MSRFVVLGYRCGVLLAAMGVLFQPVGAAGPPPAILATDESLAAWDYKLTPEDDALLEAIQRGCFAYFWKEVGAPAGLAKDKSTDTVCSTAAVGFQLSSLPIGVERGWISRDEGRNRALTALRALVGRDDNKKCGIYLHYVDENTGGQPDYSRTKYRYELQASTVDHALLQAGAMTAASYFGGEVARLADKLIADANWRAMVDDKTGYMTMGWKASTDRGVAGPGEIRPSYWEWCSDEERLLCFLAVGAPREKHAVEPAAYFRLKRIVKQHGDLPPYVVSWNGSLFTYFFSHCWIGYRDLGADDPGALGVEGPAVDWFENSRRATLTHRARCIEASQQFPTLGENRWGLAPCTFRDNYCVHQVRPNVGDIDEWHGGVVPPYGAGSAIMFAPVESLAALREYKSLTDAAGRPIAWRDPEKGGYALVDSFSLDPPYGHDEYLGIDHGPLLLAIENVRSGLVWRLFMQHPVAERAVERLRLRPR
ncbi:MAG: hypothetical protein L0Z07_07600 [Planctomycetes bacterium]|nr:hypothetical protein [Planctomycetota bacterium]